MRKVASRESECEKPARGTTWNSQYCITRVFPTSIHHGPHFCCHSALCSYIIVSFRTTFHIDRLTPYLQCRFPHCTSYIITMTVLCMRCTRDTKILGSERCVASDSKPCPACAEDIELELSIKELEDQIERIHTKRRALRTIMNENHDQLIAKFPPEIASQIFIHCAPRDENNTSNPLYLGAVCHKWRELAWRTPQLWTALFVRFYSPQLLAEYLERSASLPLSISLFPSKKMIDDEIYLEAINILNRHSSRWRVLRNALPAHHVHHLCGSQGGNILSELILRPMEESTEHRDAYDIATFSMKCKPSPTRLILAKYRLRNVRIVWNCLTRASLEHIAVDECIELMRRAPLLKTLSLVGIIRSSGTFPAPPARIILPRLRRLSILNIPDESVVAEALDSICAPSLKHWNHDLSKHPAPVVNIILFIEHSSFSLKTFNIGGFQSNYDQVHGIICRLPSLDSLRLQFRLRNRSPTDELLNQLCASDESSPFLPHLRTLEFRPQFTFPWGSLPRLFSSSIRRSLRVKVDQQADEHIPDEDVEKLLELVDAGFNLNILRDGKVDVLEEYREKRRLSQTMHQ